MKKQLTVLVLCCVMVFGALQAHAATLPRVDSSQVDLTAINAVAATQGITVGTVVPWPYKNNPADADKWLECAGQSVDSAVYPELFALTGGTLPDLRDRFLRGGTVAQAGQSAEDSIRSHAHQIDQHSHTVSGTAGKQSYSAPASGGGSGYAEMRFRFTSFTGYHRGEHVGGGIYVDEQTYGNDNGSEYTSYIPIGGGASTSAMTSGGSITGITDRGGATSTQASGGTEM